MKADTITAINIASQIQLQSGKVESTGKFYRILTRDRYYSASRAFGCLVEPMANDTVVFSVDARQHCHILSIIERPGSNNTQLTFPGDVTLRADNGELSIQASQGLNMVSMQSINQVAETYTLATKKALLSINDLTAIGHTLVSKFRHVQTIADRIETVAVHWLQKLTYSFRQVEAVDQLKTRDSIHTVKNLYSMRSKQAAILAKEDIKMDAERIHMG